MCYMMVKKNHPNYHLAAEHHFQMNPVFYHLILIEECAQSYRAAGFLSEALLLKTTNRIKLIFCNTIHK